MEGNMSAADIAAVTRPYGYGDGGFGGNSWMWLIALLFLGGGFGGYGRGYDRAATTEDLSAGFNFSGINNKLNELTAGQANINQNLGNAICSSTYELASKIDTCCCNTQRAIDSVKFDMANYNAGIQAAISAEGQKTRDMLQQNKIETLQAQINQLQLQSALCGVVRYPTTNVYATSCNPFAGFNGCGCQNI